MKFLRGYCELQDFPLAGLYVDDGISGTTALEDRPEGRRLLEHAEAGAFNVVLVYKVDRLGRSLKSLMAAHERLDKAGVAIRSGTEPFDTSNSMGRFLFTLLGSMAELDRATTLERMSRGRDRVAGDGQYTGGPIPFGYDLDAEKRLVPSARIAAPLEMNEAELVADLFRRIADGDATLNGECKRLNSLGVQRVQRYGPNRKKNTKARVLPGPVAGRRRRSPCSSTTRSTRAPVASSPASATSIARRPPWSTSRRGNVPSA